MKFFGLDIRRAVPEAKTAQFETVLQRLAAAQEGALGTIVTPETCMQSPTVHAIVTAISRRISVSPVHVYRKTTKNGRDFKERDPSHPVAKLLQYPNKWQSRKEYWLDAASTFVRHGRYFAWKSRGSTGPIRELLPLHPKEISVEQDRDTWAVRFRRGHEVLDSKRVHYVRGPARDFLNGDSPVDDVQMAIALEILAEKFGASFFQNGALPLLFFSFMQGSKGFKTAEDEKRFVDDFQNAFGGAKRFRAMVGVPGLDKPTAVPIENDKAQFLETRKYQRTVIAGAFGVPPHLVGDLERATFNNVEQQDTDFTSNVVQPITEAFEAAMERDLLTDEDINSGVCIRFNLDSILRADFKSRQEGLQVQRQNGVINANEWREIERMNPLESDEDGGEDYIRPINFATPKQADAAAEAAAKPQEKPVGDVVVNNYQSPIENKITPQTRVDMNMEPQHIRMTGGSVTLNPADVKVNTPVEVAAPIVQVEPPRVTIHPQDVTVNNAPPAVNITNDVKSPDVHIEPTTVTVPAPEVIVESPNVVVNNEVKTPEVVVEAPQVHIDNVVEQPHVSVTNEVKTPDVHVAAPVVDVKAPQVTIKNELPEYQTTEQTMIRDSQGRVEKTVTTRKRKG